MNVEQQPFFFVLNEGCYNVCYHVESSMNTYISVILDVIVELYYLHQAQRVYINPCVPGTCYLPESLYLPHGIYSCYLSNCDFKILKKSVMYSRTNMLSDNKIVEIQESTSARWPRLAVR